MSSDGEFGGRRDAGEELTVPLGDISPAGTRHMWQRSAVALADDLAVVGAASGRLRAFGVGADSTGGAERWTADLPDEYVVSLTADPAGETIVAGCRGEGGVVAAVDAASGDELWTYRAADDIGEPQRESLFFLPYVVDVAADGERFYAATRRYERADSSGSGDDGVRTFHSAVYAFEPDGSVAWTYRADASPIALDLCEDRVAVAYNRCPGDHQYGLVVLDAATGDARLTWDPGTEGQRRVGDAALLGDGGVAVASHGDYRGYRLDERGGIEWAVDLARPSRIGGETLYAYPNHVRATDGGERSGVSGSEATGGSENERSESSGGPRTSSELRSDGRIAFVTGNTYPEEGREAEGRHPNEHAIAAFDADGAERWRASVGGWVSELAAAGDRIAAPCAQHFRDRDPSAHGLRLFDLKEGPADEIGLDGVGTACALAEERVAAIEEPVEYHDGDAVRGAHRLHVLPRE